MGAVSTVSFAGLAANRMLQLDKPTAGVNRMSVINTLRIVMILLVRQPPVLGFCGIPILLQTRF
jgi:hypothetical protein